MRVINNEEDIKDGKLAAIICHFWIVGLVIGFVMNLNKKNYFTSFYLRQMIDMNLAQFLNGVVVYNYLGDTAGWIVGVLLFIGWLISLFGAFKEEEKLIPYVGEYFQNWFNQI